MESSLSNTEENDTCTMNLEETFWLLCFFGTLSFSKLIQLEASHESEPLWIIIIIEYWMTITDSKMWLVNLRSRDIACEDRDQYSLPVRYQSYIWPIGQIDILFSWIYFLITISVVEAVQMFDRKGAIFSLVILFTLSATRFRKM